MPKSKNSKTKRIKSYQFLAGFWQTANISRARNRQQVGQPSLVLITDVRSRDIPAKHKKRILYLGNQPKRYVKRVSIILCTIIILVWLIVWLSDRHRTLPTIGIRQSQLDQLTFPAYYPSYLPNGFIEPRQSTSAGPNYLYIKLTNGQQTINITEQPTPTSSLNIYKLPSFVPLSVSVGHAVIGINFGSPAAVITTQNTLINIDSANKVSKTTLIYVIDSLKPVNNIPLN